MLIKMKTRIYATPAVKGLSFILIQSLTLLVLEHIIICVLQQDSN